MCRYLSDIDDESPQDVLSYRAYGLTRWVALAIAVGFLAAAVILVAFDRSRPWGNRLGAAVFLVPGAIWLFVMALASGVDIDGDRVVVRNLWGRSVVFPTEDLDHASAALALTLHRRSGTAVVVQAVSNMTVTALIRRQGRADRVAYEINAYIRRRVAR